MSQLVPWQIEESKNFCQLLQSLPLKCDFFEFTIINSNYV